MTALASIVVCASVVQGFGPPKVSVRIDPATGTYTVQALGPGRIERRFTGHVSGAVTAVRERTGRDALGPFTEESFEWTDGGPVRGTIRCYTAASAAWFGLRYLAARHGSGISFPNFTEYPGHLRGASFHDRAFAAPTEGLVQTSTPWLLLGVDGVAEIFSPASAFLQAKMCGDLTSSLGEGLDGRVQSVPAGFEQDSILAFGSGAGAAWEAWGHLLRGLYRRRRARYDAGPLLRSFGYWTDNGADYYYNYDRSRGYAQTLLDVRKRYAAERIPLGYLQLDSWWYPKTVNDPTGRPGGTKNPHLPVGKWNRYGGLLEYRADSDLFPDGLSAFQRNLGVPLAVHNRWIDRTSPYHARYRISGVAAIDPKWWRDIASYLRSSGVITYEQDWLSEIFANSLEMATTIGVADAFADGMASSMSRVG